MIRNSQEAEMALDLAMTAWFDRIGQTLFPELTSYKELSDSLLTHLEWAITDTIRAFVTYDRSLSEQTPAQAQAQAAGLSAPLSPVTETIDGVGLVKAEILMGRNFLYGSRN